MEENEEYSPYCKLCESCGESGCCSYTNCFSKLVKNSDCKYGKTYLKDLYLDYRTVKMVFELVERLEKEPDYSKEQFLVDFKIDK